MGLKMQEEELSFEELGLYPGDSRTRTHQTPSHPQVVGLVGLYSCFTSWLLRLEIIYIITEL